LFSLSRLFLTKKSFLSKPILYHSLQTNKSLNVGRYLSSSHNLMKDQTIKSFDDLLKDDQSKKESTPNNSASMKSRLIVVSTLSFFIVVVWYYLKTDKETKDIEAREEDCKKVDIGNADFDLVDHTGKKVSKKDFLGKWLIMYFGFTHCPDICPEELERITDIVDDINKNSKLPDLLPVFMSVDPARDTPKAISEYLKDFHPTFVGLTGTEDQIKIATKSFRVYYSSGPKDDENDYIVDHSIIMYLMDPNGNFVDYYGSRSTSVDTIVESISKRMNNFLRLHG